MVFDNTVDFRSYGSAIQLCYNHKASQCMKFNITIATLVHNHKCKVQSRQGGDVSQKGRGREGERERESDKVCIKFNTTSATLRRNQNRKLQRGREEA